MDWFISSKHTIQCLYYDGPNYSLPMFQLVYEKTVWQTGKGIDSLFEYNCLCLQVNPIVGQFAHFHFLIQSTSEGEYNSGIEDNNLTLCVKCFIKIHKKKLTLNMIKLLMYSFYYVYRSWNTTQ
jgi:hypothetical protein